MPAPVSYWTGIWEPRREAISSQVDLLRRTFGNPAPVVSFSSGQRSRLPSDGVVRLSGRRWLLLRALAAAVERRAAITHVVGDMHSWHLLRAVGRRPIVFTAAVPGPPLDAALYAKVAVSVAETEPLADALRSAGVPDGRIEIIYPGVDTSRFRPAERDNTRRRFRVVFASSPASLREMEIRGIPLLVEAARLVPDCDIILQWRQWGEPAAAERAIAALRPPVNLRVHHRDVTDMSEVFRQADATIWLSAEGHGKSCPNSVIEGLASGCPAIVSRACGVGSLIGREEAGFVVERDPRAVADALRRVMAARDAYALRARAVAERHFSRDVFIARHRVLYSKVAAGEYDRVPAGRAGLATGRANAATR